MENDVRHAPKREIWLYFHDINQKTLEVFSFSRMWLISASHQSPLSD